MVPKLDFYIIDLGSFSKLHFDEVSLFQYAKVSEVVYILYIYGVFSIALGDPIYTLHICNVYTVFLRGISNNIPPKPRHFFVLGLASVSGVYCWIYHEKTPYIQYISHLEGFFRISKYVKKILIFPFWLSKYVNQILIFHSICTYPQFGGYI